VYSVTFGALAAGAEAGLEVGLDSAPEPELNHDNDNEHALLESLEHRPGHVPPGGRGL
jgi:hypothetical protein